MRLRKNMKRTAAAVLALSMAVSAVAAPASAAYICDVSRGNVEVSVDTEGNKSIKVGGVAVEKSEDDSDDIIITGDNTKPTESQNAEEENTSEVEKSGENASEVEKSGETKTEGEGKTQNSATEGEDEGDEPTSQELLAPEDEEKKDEEKKDEQKPADSQEPEQTEKTEKTSDQVIEYGQYDPEAQQEATKPAAKPAAKQETGEKKAAEEKTYEDTNAPTTLSEKAQAAANNVVKIINNSANALKVILRDLKVDAGNTKENAVTVSGSGNVTLELDGKNELTGGTGLKNYDIARAGAGLRAEGKGTTTIEDKDGNGSLVATGGTLTVSDTMGKSSYAASGRGIDGAEIAGGNVIGKGGDIISDVSDSGGKFFGAGTGILTKKISGGIVEAIGGDVTGIDGKDGMIIVTAGQGLGGDGYANAYSGPIEISGGTVKATGGNVLIDRGLEEPYDGADGVHTTNEVRVSGGTLIAQGGNTKDGDGGSGIGNATISGGTVVAVGGTGSKTGGDGFNKSDKVKVTGGEVTAQGGKGNNKNGAAVGNDKNVTGTVNKVESGHVHEYADSQTVKEATCTSEGYKLKKCSKCGVEELERIAIDKDAHSWVESKHKDATCTEDGYTEYKCSACGETKRDNIISATGEHHFTVVKEVVAPTYTSEGYTIYKCETCDETEKRDVVPMLVPESNGGSSAVTLTVTRAGAYETSMADGRYVVAVPAEAAVLSGCLGNLKELKAQGVNTLVFRTQLRETALNIDSMLSLGVDDTLFALTHSGESAELTVGGVAHNELLH
jgi:DNA-directed RNA polymerase subunit RPC12/RpoP